jgi:hypothetical protein
MSRVEIPWCHDYASIALQRMQEDDNKSRIDERLITQHHAMSFNIVILSTYSGPGAVETKSATVFCFVLEISDSDGLSGWDA